MHPRWVTTVILAVAGAGFFLSSRPFRAGWLRARHYPDPTRAVTILYSHAPRWTPAPRTAVGRWRWSLAGLLALAGLALAGLTLFQGRIGRQLARTAEGLVNARLAESGWSVSFDQFQVVDTGTLRIGTVRLHAGSSSQPPVCEAGPILVRKNGVAALLEMNWHPDELVLEGTEFRIDCGRSTPAQWSSLLECLKRNCNHQRPPAIGGQGCRVVIFDSHHPDSVPWLLRDVTVAADNSQAAGQRPSSRIALSGRGNQLEGLEAEIEIGPLGEIVHCLARATGFRIAAHDLDWLPQEWRSRLGSVSQFQARADLRADFVVPKTAGAAPGWTVSGHVSDLDLAATGCPLPVADARCEFLLKSGRLSVSQVVAGVGSATLTGSGQLLVAGLGKGGDIFAQPWAVRGRLTGLQADAIAPGSLPEEARRWFAQLAPSGSGDFDFDLDWDGRALNRRIVAQVQDMSFTWHRFPWTIQRCVGNASWIGDEFRFALQSLDNGQIVDLSGWVRQPGPDAIWRVEFGCPGDLPVDEKLLQAIDLYPQVAGQIRDLRLRGTFGVRGSFCRENTSAAPLLTYAIDLKHCQVRPARFDYPVREITGQIQVAGRRFDLQQVNGKCGGAPLRVSGGWNPDMGLSLQLIANDLPLDATLRSALPPQSARVWDQLRPAGNARLVHVDLTVPPQAGVEPVVHVEADLEAPGAGDDQGVSLLPEAFPWRITRVGAKVRIGPGRFEALDFRASHGEAWISASLRGEYSAGGWEMRMSDLAGGNLEFDDELLKALPPGLGQSLRQIQVRGKAALGGSLAFRFNGTASPSGVGGESPVALVSYPASNGRSSATNRAAALSGIDAAWNLKFDFQDASASPGLPLEHVSGTIRLAGSQVGGETGCRGLFVLDAASVHGAWITELQGPISLDSHQVAIGMFAGAPSDGGPARPALGKICAGEISLDAHYWDEAGGQFFAQASLAGADLRKAGGCLSREIRESAGYLAGQLRCSGKPGDESSLTGDGTLQLTEARLYELPVMVPVLQALRRSKADRAAFDTAHIDFALRGDQIDLNRIELNGDAISLIGDGRMDWHRKINLDFYTVMGRNQLYLPLLSELYRASSQQIMWLSVDGTLDRPELSQQILPGLNEGLQKLLATEKAE